jgi:transposase
MERSDRATWAKRVESWKRSGLSAQEFAGRHGLRARTLIWWRWRLGRGSQSAALTVRKATTAVGPLTFVEMTSTSSREPFEVVLASDLRVRVPVTFDERALVRLLDVLERR